MKRAVLYPPAGIPDACAIVPGSKSLTNRALVLSALAAGETDISNILVADDTLRMLEALETLGFAVDADEHALTVHVSGSGGVIPVNEAQIYAHQAGTVMRFLTAVLSSRKGNYRLDGDDRMRQRPIGALVKALRGLGAGIRYVKQEGFPPLDISGGAQPGCTSIDATVSSQFVSGLLMGAAMHSEPTRISLEGEITSRPFIDVTLKMLHTFGAEAGWKEKTVLEARGPLQSPGKYTIQSDATAAGYFWAAAAITGGHITVGNISRECLQGDIRFTRVLEEMGCKVSQNEAGITVQGGPLKGGAFDLNSMPDVVQTLAVTALFAEGPTRIENIANLRLKETDRLAALETELSKLGAGISTGRDSIEITPRDHYQPAALDTYDDHRMAMSLALTGLKIPGVEINNPDCVNKTYPEYFHALQNTVGIEAQILED